MRAASAAVLSLAVLAACAAPRIVEPPRRTIVAPSRVGLEDQDALIELARGARVHVSLEADRVSGQSWHLGRVSGDALEAYGNRWYAVKHAFAVRELGHWIFDFNAVAPGRSAVTFDFRRDDEPATAAERRASFEFVVR